MIDLMLAIIPARKGSKGLPGKNTITFGSVPLIEWTLSAAVNSRIFENVVVSSDCEDVERISKRYRAKFVERSSGLALDSTPMKDVVVDVLNRGLASSDGSFALLQPTSPLRNENHIRACHRVFVETGNRCCISVTKTDESLLKSFIVKDGVLVALEKGRYAERRRQDLPRVVKPNGAIYMQNIELFRRGESFTPTGSAFYVMDEEKSIDIDTKEDLVLAERYLC